MQSCFLLNKKRFRTISSGSSAYLNPKGELVMHINWAAIAAEMTRFMKILGDGSFDVCGATDLIILNRILHHCIIANGFIYRDTVYHPNVSKICHGFSEQQSSDSAMLKLWGRRTASNDHHIICYISNLLSL